MTLGQFFDKFGYSQFFYENYVLPMTAAIWSTPADMTFDKFPLLTLVRFMRNHMMLQLGGRPKWRTVFNGSREYVKKVLQGVPDARLETPIVSVKRNRTTGKVSVTDSKGNTEVFDHVIFATHTDQALQILGEDATPEEKKVLGSIKYLDNVAYLHRDNKVIDSCRDFQFLSLFFFFF
jgi:predicted NAD/FAD-binding protein